MEGGGLIRTPTPPLSLTMYPAPMEVTWMEGGGLISPPPLSFTMYPAPSEVTRMERRTGVLVLQQHHGAQSPCCLANLSHVYLVPRVSW